MVKLVLNGKKKYNEQDIKIVRDLANELKGQNEHLKILELEMKKRGYNISRKIIKKILEDKY